MKLVTYLNQFSKNDLIALAQDFHIPVKDQLTKKQIIHQLLTQGGKINHLIGGGKDSPDIEQLRAARLRRFNPENILPPSESQEEFEETSENQDYQFPSQTLIADTIALPEHVLREILNNLPFQDLRKACQINKQAARLCKKPDFWIPRIQKDFGISKETILLKIQEMFPHIDQVINGPQLYLELGYRDIQEWLRRYDENYTIEELHQLTDLSLSGNEITEIPESIGNLTNLQKLILRGIRITRIPESIGKLTNLEGLWLDGTQLTMDQIPKNLRRIII